MKTWTRSLCVVMAITLALAAGSALAYTSNDWINTTTGDYGTAGNWSGGAVPGTSDWVYPDFR